MQKKIATGKIYLGGSFNREIDHERVERAKEILAKNPTIAKVHFPFDYDFVDPEEKNPEIGGQRSMTWRVGTFQNDLNGINSATCGVFLYDMDVLDDGCAFEIDFMRANHKPVVLVPFTEHPERPKKMNLMIAQGVTAIIDGNTELEKLAEYDFNWTPYIPVTGYGIY
ncbi:MULTISPECIES: nucleoside 2-deoxyribosyltransferase [unclassified Lactobacillus]|uniref:nucleoside 2-deoxyribosyltransferase n=1 Tax=unclassified Lactobacillus TaxID=2620435 RepID=UPI000BEED1C8|nr:MULTISPECIES: nucleoside 2-deoxyribosyltransferase [unclassified Lactobacillus]PEG87101.1 nucleoside 2-deoxyribosyltransferase [Lactobacillus sp. UMNPBX14]PEH02615.1 nucleoside 2-deoxyribosyltransferase [Lactobacillus sp. UMNPBX6]